MRGRKPIPTSLKILRGNPGKRKLNRHEPRPAPAIPTCPRELDRAAKTEWKRLAKILAELGLLTQCDRGSLAAYCAAYSRFISAERDVGKYGSVILSPDKKWPTKSPYLCVAEAAAEQMRKFGAELGLSPSSRSRLKTGPPDAGDDEFERFLHSG